MTRKAMVGATLFALAFFVAAARLSAQQTGTVTGVVLSGASEEPLAGVQVSVIGTRTGTVTDARGGFTITGVPVGQRTVRAEMIGRTRRDQVVTVTENAVVSVRFSLEVEAVALQEVLVTALGISRQERALGYSAQGVKGEDIVQAREANLVNALAGKVAGVQVTNVGPQGGQARIVLRGASSISGENQPLFILNGVPVNNSYSTYIRGGRRSGGSDPTDPTPTGSDYGNAISDINPDDIESITVLKGPNAAALYGSRAANGAVVITTKTGRKRGTLQNLQVTASTNITIETPLKMPSYQNEYGQGANGQFAFVNGRGGGTNDGVDESWGPKLDGRPMKQWNTGDGTAPWIAYPYNVRQFFEAGQTVDTHADVSGSNERANVRLSLSRMDLAGMIPHHKIERTNVTLTGGIDVTQRFNISGSGTYTVRAGRSVPGVGYTNFNPLQGYIWFGRQVDTWDLRDYKNEDGTQRNWNYNYHDNPYFESFERENSMGRDRLNGHVQGQYRFTPWADLMLRTGTDWYEESRKESRPATTARVTQASYDESLIFRQETNTEALLTLNRDVNPDVNVALRIGGSMLNSTDKLNVTQVNALTIPGVYSVSNAATPPVLRDYLGRKKIHSVYGFGTVGFRNYVFVDVTGRNDWSSTLPSEFNSYFYPSVSGSLVFTDALNSAALRKVLSYGKLRASWARVGNDAKPYQLAAVLDRRNPFGSLPGFTVSDVLPNAELRPEKTISREVGTELRAFGDRVTLDLTVYNSATTDQILPVQVSAASGYTNRVLNAGKITNKGIEAVVGFTPVKLSNTFTWEVNANWSRNRSLVAELYGKVETIVLGEFWGINVEARKGQPYGVLYGYAREKHANGQPLVDSRGLPVRAANKSVLGNYNPDFLAGLRNTFNYRDLSVSFLIDWRQGGELFSVTNMWGKYSGVLKESAENRETGMVINGVTADGQPNTKVVSAEQFQHAQYQIQSYNIFDATFVKLREVRVGFDLPANVVRYLPVQSARVALTGRNLWLMKSNVPNVDPETGFDASNFQGVEYGQLPSARSFGMSISVVPR